MSAASDSAGQEASPPAGSKALYRKYEDVLRPAACRAVNAVHTLLPTRKAEAFQELRRSYGDPAVAKTPSFWTAHALQILKPSTLTEAMGTFAVLAALASTSSALTCAVLILTGSMFGMLAVFATLLFVFVGVVGGIIGSMVLVGASMFTLVAGTTATVVTAGTCSLIAAQATATAAYTHVPCVRRLARALLKLWDSVFGSSLSERLPPRRHADTGAYTKPVSGADVDVDSQGERPPVWDDARNSTSSSAQAGDMRAKARAQGPSASGTGTERKLPPPPPVAEPVQPSGVGASPQRPFMLDASAKDLGLTELSLPMPGRDRQQSDGHAITPRLMEDDAGSAGSTSKVHSPQRAPPAHLGADKGAVASSVASRDASYASLSAATSTGASPSETQSALPPRGAVAATLPVSERGGMAVRDNPLASKRGRRGKGGAGRPRGSRAPSEASSVNSMGVRSVADMLDGFFTGASAEG